MKFEFILLIILIIAIVGAPVIRKKYKDNLSKPKIKKIFGYLLIILSGLAFILSLLSMLLGDGINLISFILSMVGVLCFLVLGIILLRKNK